MFKNFQPYKNPLAQGCLLPNISIDQRFYDELVLPSSVSNYEFLRRLCWKGIQEKGIDKLDNAKEYYEKIKYELSTLKELGFDEYMLLNWEILNFCRENKIPTGDGRGSAAGCLIAYLLGITKVDPLKHGLFFERFVSKSRARKIIGDDGIVYLDGSLVPDIDNDIDYEQRHKVIEFINEKHKGRTCRILTLNTLSGKLCMKESLKIVEGVEEIDANEVSDSIPKKFGIVVEFDEAEKESDKFREFVKKYSRSYKIAKKLNGLVKNAGVHPSGIAICNHLLGDTMPFSKTKDGDLVSGLEMNDVASVAVKFDILGLRTLTVLNKVYDMVGIKGEDIPMDNQDVFMFLQNLVAPQGIFQIETDTGFRVCQKVRPKNILDLSAVLALARPGALAFVDQYAKYSSLGEYQSIHPFFDDVLKFTGGIPLYQEELISCARKIGFSADEGEMLRRCAAKKKQDEMAKWQSLIKDKVAENNLDPKIGEILWKLAEDSAKYSFNFSHSLAYATCSYRTIYTKVHYPKEFYVSLLQMAMNEPDPFEEISKVTQELPYFNIKLLPPDLSKSQKDFSIEGNNLRYGLSSIKGVSEKTIDNLLDFRGKESSNKYELFCNAKDSGMAINILCGLIQAGCLDSFGEDRPLTILEAQMFNALTPTERAALVECGEDHSYDVFAGLRDAAAGRIMNAKGKPVFSEKKLAKLREEHIKFKQIYDQNIKHHKFCNWYFERKLLGYSYSYNLREVFDEPKNSFMPAFEVSSLEDNDRVRIVGVVGKDVKKAKSKKTGETYLSLELSDETGRVRCLFMDTSKGRKFSEYVENGNILPKEENILVIVGKKNKDVIFVDSMEIMDERIALKLKDLKN